MVEADYLFLMTDVDCLYQSNPRTNPDAKPLPVIKDIDVELAEQNVNVSTAGSSLGTGGMQTKIVAARLATSAGVTTIITRSSKPGNISKIVRHLQAIDQVVNGVADNAHLSTDVPLHTVFLPSTSPIRDRTFWILHGLAPKGTIFIDEGAYHALRNKSSLLPVGIVDLQGIFAQQEAVKLVAVRRHTPMHVPQSPSTPSTPSSRMSGGMAHYGTDIDFDESPQSAEAEPRYDLIEEIGKAVVNFSSAEIIRIKGMQSGDIRGVLGYADSEYVAHRDNISLTVKLTSRTGGRATPPIHR
jgi:glutamate 5-kinase